MSEPSAPGQPNPGHPPPAPGKPGRAKTVRLDKWLQVARAFKTRTQATHACALGRVRVNGNLAKPHRPIAVEDVVEIEQRDWTRLLVIKALADKPPRKEDAKLLFEDKSPPRPELDPLERLMRRAPVARERGAGRPTKRDRREIEKLTGE